MTTKRWEDLRRKTFSSTTIHELDHRIEQELLEMDLREIRQVLGKTQVEVAELLKTGQGQVSMTERRDDHLVSTLRRYVEALGGRLEIIADFGDKKIRLNS